MKRPPEPDVSVDQVRSAGSQDRDAPASLGTIRSRSASEKRPRKPGEAGRPLWFWSGTSRGGCLPSAERKTRKQIAASSEDRDALASLGTIRSRSASEKRPRKPGEAGRPLWFWSGTSRGGCLPSAERKTRKQFAASSEVRDSPARRASVLSRSASEKRPRKPGEAGRPLWFWSGTSRGGCLPSAER